MKKLTIILLIMVCFCSCNLYKPYNSTLAKSTKNCNELKEFTRNNWFKHKSELVYNYKGAKKEFEDRIYKEFKDCFFDLTIEEVKALLGEPSNEIPNDEFTYYLNTDCLIGFSIGDCDILLISFDNSTLKPVSLMFQ